MTYINEVREDTVFDSTNTEFIEQLFLRCPTSKEDPLSAINCMFEEKFDAICQLELRLLLMISINTTASPTFILLLQKI